LRERLGLNLNRLSRYMPFHPFYVRDIHLAQNLTARTDATLDELGPSPIG